MNILFWRNKKQAEKLDAIEHEAAAVHAENISKLKENREKIDTLNTALQENHIVFQLAHVIGATKQNV